MLAQNKKQVKKTLLIICGITLSTLLIYGVVRYAVKTELAGAKILVDLKMPKGYETKTVKMGVK